MSDTSNWIPTSPTAIYNWDIMIRYTLNRKYHSCTTKKEQQLIAINERLKLL